MDRFEGHCGLDWWANSSTLLGSAEVAVVITASKAGWDAQARLASGDDDEREGFAFLSDLDPVFTLRFEDGNTVPVMVDTDGDRITLTQYTGPAHRSVDHQIGCSRHRATASSRGCESSAPLGASRLGTDKLVGPERRSARHDRTP